jgi:tripartite-type tricarboxylate transporter receptor subunit TctC
MRRVSAYALAAAAGACGMCAAAADIYPNRPLRLIVPFAPGGGLEITARGIAQKLTEKYGHAVVIDNRPGAATIVGTEIAAKANPDGYTLLMITTTFAINPSLYPKLPYDPMRDFAPVTQINSVPNILVVNPAIPAQTVRELIALAKSKPGQLSYASAGAGTSPHLAAELFKTMAGIDMMHIPYKGIAPAVTDVIAGRVSMLMTTTISAAPHVKSGRLRALAVTSLKPSALTPGLPTVAESGVPGYESVAIFGVLAPAQTPPDIINRLQREVARAAANPEVRKRFLEAGVEPVGSTPEEYTATIRREMAKWGKLIKDLGIRED